MSRVLSLPILGLTVIAGVVLVGAQALADDSSTHSRTSRRQLADCIIKRMSADRTVSFNEATRTCKDPARTQISNDLASIAPAKSVGR
jgi:hypothetical protein